MVIGAIILFGIIALVDLRPLIQGKKKLDSIVLLIILVIGLTIAILWACDVKIPSPEEKLEEFLYKKFGSVYPVK